MVHRLLHKERRKGVVRDRLMVRMLKSIKSMCTCVDLDKELHQLDLSDFGDLSMLNEVWNGITP